MKLTMTLIVALLVSIAAVPVAAEPIVINPSFEDDGANTATPTGWSPMTSPQMGVGWGGAATYNGAFWDNGITSDGDYVCILEPGKWGDEVANPISIEQTIAGFEVGQPYTVSFSYNARTQAEDSPTLRVYMDGVEQFSDVAFNPVDDIGVQANSFYPGSFDYTATETSHTLKFEALADGPEAPDHLDESVFFDDVKVTLVPEPGTLALLASLGLCGLAWWKRRRKP